MSTREWVAAEAERRGLALDEHEVQEIAERLSRVREALRRIREKTPERPEPPYRFVVSEVDASQ